MYAGVKTSNLKSQLAGQVSSAEALWTMKTADSNLLFSTSYCPAFFQEIYPESMIAKMMRLSANKASYTLIS